MSNSITTINSNLVNKISVGIGNIKNKEKEDNQDIEDFLPFHSVRNCNHILDNKIITSIIPKKRINPERNIPLLVKDILQLQLQIGTATEKRYFSAYGIPFETVTVYGNLFGHSNKQSILDDGTGTIPVKYTCNKNIKSALNKLRIELDNKIELDQIRKNQSEMEINLSLNRLLKHSEDAIHINGTNFKNGSSVCVIGRLYIFKNSIYLNAYEINVDNKQNRDKEIFFKRDLIRYYTTHYVSCNIDGSKK